MGVGCTPCSKRFKRISKTFVVDPATKFPHIPTAGHGMGHPQNGRSFAAQRMATAVTAQSRLLESWHAEHGAHRQCSVYVRGAWGGGEGDLGVVVDRIGLD